MRHPELPVVSFLCIFLLLCCLPCHIRAGSISTIALIAWLAVMSLIRGINALVWANNFDVKFEVWCDIATKITVGFTYAVPAAALCILRHLESVASTRHALTTKAEKRQRQKFEALMCFGVPMIFMALHYIVQGHRFDLFEDFGCYPSVYFSVASIMIIWVPPLVMSLITFVYAALSLRHFLHHRIEFAAHLQNSQSTISPGHYFRLMSMAVVEMVWDTGINIYIIWFNTLTGLRPWISWEDVHSNFSRVGVIPQFLNPPALMTQLIWQWWIVPISCFFFFIFFAFGREAIADYRRAIVWLRHTILRQKNDMPRPQSNAMALPTHRRPPPNVNITLPVISDDGSDHEHKPYELSFKMPEIAYYPAPPSGTDTSAVTVTHPTPFGEAIPDAQPASLGFRTAKSRSLYESRRPSSVSSSSEATSFTTPGHSTQSSPVDLHNYSSRRISTVHVTHPETEASPMHQAQFITPLTPNLSPPAMRRLPSHIAPPPSSSHRQSTSSDYGITVSPVYFHDASMPYHYHEDELLDHSTPGNSQPVHP